MCIRTFKTHQNNWILAFFRLKKILLSLSKKCTKNDFSTGISKLFNFSITLSPLQSTVFLIKKELILACTAFHSSIYLDYIVRNVFYSKSLNLHGPLKGLTLTLKSLSFSGLCLVFRPVGGTLWNILVPIWSGYGHGSQWTASRYVRVFWPVFWKKNF